MRSGLARLLGGFSLYETVQNAIARRVIRDRKVSWEEPGLFDAVFFEVVNKCNSRCSFCGASVQNDVRPRKEMSFALFASVVDQLAALHFAGRVAFHVANEPLLFPGLEQFVAHARTNLPDACLQVMTNGLALTPERGRALIDSGLDDLYINFYRTSRKQQLYPNAARFITDVLEPSFPVRKGQHYSSADGRRRLHFTLSRRLVKEVRWSRGGTSPNKTVTASRARGLCLYPWKQFNISAEGLVSKCCADIGFDDPMGDLREQSVMDIWRGRRFATLRQCLLRGDRQSLPHCRACDFFGVSTEDIANPLLKCVKYHLLARY